MVAVLTALYGVVWNAGDLPASWDEALIKYIHKKHSKMEVSNYRPISLISVIAKTFTKTFLPRLQKATSCSQVKEQGCGRKHQGAPEHLWAFMAQMEECVEGDHSAKDGEAFALFADVAKAFDQVWRDGLYLALYASGVRGPMWKIIQRWLNKATAQTSWNGVRGPSVALEEGLRQGCCLSPVLYSIFINTFLGEVPQESGAPPVPDCAEKLVSEFYSQGLQREPLRALPEEDQAAMGVWNGAMG